MNLFTRLCQHTPITFTFKQLLLKYCLLHLFNSPVLILVLIEVWIKLYEAVH